MDWSACSWNGNCFMEVLSIVCKRLPVLLIVLQNRGHQRSSCTITRLLITAGCDVHLSNSSGATALHMAVANACIDCAELICTSAIDSCAALVNAQDNDGIAPIHTAAKLDDARASSMIALLCQHGANLSISPHVKQSAETALHISVRRGAYAATAMLLKEGADVLAVDKWGYNCLVCAARHLNREVLLLLLHAVERKLWNVKDVWGHTPLQHSYKLASMFKLHTTIRHWWYCTITFSGGT